MMKRRLKHEDSGVTRREVLRGGSALAASLLFGKFFRPGNALAQKLGTVSIAEMKKWNEDTKKYRVLGNGTTKTSFATLVKVQFNGSVFVATGLVDYTGKHGTKLAFKYKDSKGKIRTYPDLDLNSLARLYKKQTGKKLTSFEIVVEKDKDKNVGDYIQFWVVPNGEFKPGVPVLAAYGYAQGNVGTSDKPDLLAYAK